MDIDKMLKNFKEEAENMALGHDVINNTIDAKFFNSSVLENLVVDGDEFSEYGGQQEDPEHSTFDEANYVLVHGD